MPSSSSFTIISKSTVYPAHKSSSVQTLRLSVSDLPMLACHYIQKGVLLTAPPPNHHHNHEHLISDLKASLSTTLTHFPALAGRLTTDSSGHIHITCNDSGVEFVQASAKHLTLTHLISPDDDVHAAFKKFFTFDATLSYSGHTEPLAAVQVTELADGLFIGCTVNHAVVDGTSFWHFFNTFAEISKGCKKISHVPDFVRSISPFDSSAVLKIPPGGPKATFADDEPLRERIFNFSKEAIADLKLRANSIVIHQKTPKVNEEKMNGSDLVKFSALENLLSNNGNDVAIAIQQQKADEISSFQSLSAQLWRSVTRVRDLKPEKQTTFRMAVNCRSRLEPNLSSHYFGNAIQSIPTVAPAGALLANDLNWAADQLHKNVVAHDDAKIRWGVKDWESNPRLFPLGNFDGAMITMGSSPRFPMYNNDFGWGRPVAVRSGKANKFDGKISAFPGRDGGGSVDLEVCLAPETMAGLERDYEFMQYVSGCNWLK
ncbi:unnamed protein product [Rhodiola kirilowii]